MSDKIINLDELVAEPLKVVLGGETYELPEISTKQYVDFSRAIFALQGAAEAGDLDALDQACELLDEMFPEVAKAKRFEDLAPVQLQRVIEFILTASTAGRESGEEPTPLNRGTRRAAKRKRA